MTKIYKNLSSEEKKSIFFTIGLIIIGYTMAIFSNPLLFARFGSLIVCIGVYFGFKGVSIELDNDKNSKHSELEELYHRRTNEITHADSLYSSDFRGRDDTSFKRESAKIQSKIYLKMKENIDQQTHDRKKSLMKIEGAILIIGTLIWGFGDLIVPSQETLTMLLTFMPF